MSTAAQRRNDRAKKAERRLARVVNGRRVGNRGESSADVIAEPFAFELKTRDSQTFPKWLLKAFAQAEKAAEETGLTGVVVLEHREGREHQRYFCLRQADWLAWLGT